MTTYKFPITVIICMYKGEATVRRMIDCVLNQTFRDFELILVDDGSPDRCGEIAEEYVQKDNRVRVLHKENGGLAFARRSALEIAQGEYTIQFDQDDWVEENCLEEMLKAAKEQQTDMLIADYYRGDEYVMHYVTQKPTSTNHLVVMRELWGSLQAYYWNKMIRRDVFERFDIVFSKEIYSLEDMYVMLQILKHDIKIGYLPMAFVHYMYNSGSLIRYYDEKAYRNDILNKERFHELLEDYPEAQQAAELSLTRATISRAFMFGREYFSNKMFQQEFREYKGNVLHSEFSKIERYLIYLSCCGYYHLCNWMFWKGFRLKQVMKRIKS